jgi:hypothetical protein
MEKKNKEIKYLKFIAIDNSLTDFNIKEDFDNLDFIPIEIDNVSFYFSNSRYEWFLNLVAKNQLINEANKPIKTAQFKKHLKEYGKGFREGYFNYSDKIHEETELFKSEKKVFINKIFSKVYDTLNVSIMPIQLIKGGITKADHIIKIIESDIFNQGIRDGEIYKAWTIIAEYSPMFEKRWEKEKKQDDDDDDDISLENYNTPTTPIKKNLHPRIFTTELGLILFEALKEKLVKNLLADYSFIYRKMQKEKLIYTSIGDSEFRRWLNDTYEIEIEKTKQLYLCKTTVKEQLYSQIKESIKQE